MKPARTVLMLGTIGLILTGGSPAGARPPAPADAQGAGVAGTVKLPAGRVGELAAAYVAVFNGSSDQATAEFERNNRSTARLKEASVEERVERVKKMRADFGVLRVKEVMDASESEVWLACESETGKPVGLRFVLDSKEAGKLDFIEVSSGGPLQRPEPVTQEEVASLVERVAKRLEKYYVYPDVAAKMGAAIRENLAKGAYAGVKNDATLVKRLTDDLRAVSKDKHLGVGVLPPEMRTEAEENARHGPMPWELARDNYGFRTVERLEGNIGYVKFDFFAGVPEARATASAAMNFVAHCDAIIFDMRQNGGGSPEMIRYITSYLFDQKTHLNDMIDREGKTVEEFWTLEEVPGERIPAEVPVYVLTSARTFSGAEEFSYNLKNLKRATIIGETTGGGAHPVRPERIGDRFVVRVPYMRANNPISKTNWEGTGVAPDIAVPAKDALDRAMAEARKSMQQRRSDGK